MLEPIGRDPIELDISRVARLVCVRCGDAFHSEAEDFLIAEMADDGLIIPCEQAWYSPLVQAGENFLERSSRIFQGYCSTIPRHWSGRGIFRGVRVLPALRSAPEISAALENGIIVSSDPTTFNDITWND